MIKAIYITAMLIYYVGRSFLYALWVNIRLGRLEAFEAATKECRRTITDIEVLRLQVGMHKSWLHLHGVKTIEKPIMKGQ